jgi:hypothetical protein
MTVLALIIAGVITYSETIGDIIFELDYLPFSLPESVKTENIIDIVDFEL